MEIVSTNIATKRTVVWQGKDYETGIFKYPVYRALQLEKNDVKGDSVMDRKFHGGIDKAVYLYSEDHYPFWKGKYSNVEWIYGMFGENLTVKNCNEKSILIGDTYEVGNAIIQVSQPRQPCFKLGIRFNSQEVVKDFIQQSFSGVYFRIIKEGKVKQGDRFKLVERPENSISVAQVFQLLYQQQDNYNLINTALKNPFLSEDCKKNIKRKTIDQTLKKKI